MDTSTTTDIIEAMVITIPASVMTTTIMIPGLMATTVVMIPDLSTVTDIPVRPDKRRKGTADSVPIEP